MPSGELKAYTNNKSHRWYYVNGSARKYLSRNNRTLAEKLALKKYLFLRKKELLEDKNNINNRLILLDSKCHEEMEKFLNSASYFELLPKNINRQEDWRNEEFKTNPLYPEQRNVPCPSGNFVRSKSEVFIDMALSQAGIPYRYECELILGKQNYYPDFTILHPGTGEVIYWEHFGKMNDPDYARSAFNKMRKYYENGLIPGKNLIVTFETRGNPFTFNEAQAALTMMKL